MSRTEQPEPLVFNNLGDAFKFLDHDLNEAIKHLKIYHHHVTELMGQIAQKAASADDAPENHS